MKICKPFKKCSVSNITQGFSNSHKAIDFFDVYGTFLVAPENCIVEYISSESLEPLMTGYGMRLRSTSNPYLFYSYCHTLPIFPVLVGEIIRQGQIICQMGNSGCVFSNGKYVPVEDRTKPPYYGTHLHFAIFTEMNGKREYKNPMDCIDWELPVRYSAFDVVKAISKITLKMIGILKGRFH